MADTEAAATSPTDPKEFVMRNGIKFEKKSTKSAVVRPPTFPDNLQSNVDNDRQGFFSRLVFGRRHREDPAAIAPDADFCAESLIKLSHGVTAYRLIEPSTAEDDAADEIPVIVCLHGMYNSSYMWADCADLLCDCERGPNSRVLVFDFYGRGRSPWTGVPITLDVLVVQTKELLDLLGLSTHPVSFIGYDLGGAVATGFCAKYPDLCQSLTLIAAMGCKYRVLEKEALIKKKYFGEYIVFKRRGTFGPAQEDDFHDTHIEAPHRAMIDKQIAMINWQILNTPGYLGAILSTIRLFPMRGMEELFTAIGRFKRPVLVLWGDNDEITPYKKCIKVMERSFPNGFIVDIRECGHNVLIEKFNESMTEILSFHKITFDAIEEKQVTEDRAGSMGSED